MTLTAAHQRGEDQDLVPGIVVEDHLYDALLGVLHHLLTGGVAVGTASTGEEQTEVVVDLGGGADGGAGILVGGLLLNADNGREAGDLIHVRALHASKEVAGIGGEGLNIAALALGEDGVKGQRRLAGTAEAGDDGEGVVRDGTVDVLQIMYPGTIYVDACLFFHVCSYSL